MEKFKGITLILSNSKLTKEGVLYKLTLRTEQAKRIIERYALAKNLHIEILVDPPPIFYPTKEAYLDSLIKKNELFKELVQGLGLKLVKT